MVAGMMLYYTILSNMLVMFFMGDMVMHASWSFDPDPRLPSHEGAVTMAIMITFVIYHFMLAPLETPEKSLSFGKLPCHYIVPLMFFFDTLVIDKSEEIPQASILSLDLDSTGSVLLALLNGLALKCQFLRCKKDSPFASFLYQCE